MPSYLRENQREFVDSFVKRATANESYHPTWRLSPTKLGRNFDVDVEDNNYVQSALMVLHDDSEGQVAIPFAIDPSVPQYEDAMFHQLIALEIIGSEDIPIAEKDESEYLSAYLMRLREKGRVAFRLIGWTAAEKTDWTVSTQSIRAIQDLSLMTPTVVYCLNGLRHDSHIRIDNGTVDILDF